MITLGRGGLELDVTPELGGAVTRLEFEHRPVLRAVSPGPASVLDCCSFPLVPFANRIVHGTFVFQGKTYNLPRNMGDHPHTLHGHGWLAPWQVVSLARDRAVLSFEHAADTWPWRYSVEQVFELGENTARFTLSLQNRDDKPMPCSLGLHPYFPRLPGSRLTAAVSGMWLADDTMVPTEHTQKSLIDLTGGQVIVKAPFVDNTFTGWNGVAEIDQPDLGLLLTLKASGNCPFFHVFIPDGENYFCAEPTTAMPNAFNRSESDAVTGMTVVAPGESIAMQLEISVAARR